jgi:pimeloyl-ACP methyl ester carboxylesterase
MNRKLTSIIIFGIISSIVLTSCEKLFVEKPSNEQDKFLVSYDFVKDISTIEINYGLTQLQLLYPDVETIKSKVTSGVRIYKVKYKTIFQSDTIVASGLVCVPLSSGTYPLLSFQNGTITLHRDAPTVASNESEMGKFYWFLETVASTGFVLAIPDYIGFGESANQFHPYLDKVSTVQCVLDMLRATKELVADHNLKVNMTDNLYITGYSMGGWATLQLQKAIETNYSDEFNLKASACSAGPYNLIYINSYVLGLKNYPMPYFLGYMLNSYKNLGQITNNISDIINEPYASRVQVLYDGTNDGDQINKQLTTSVSDFFTEAYRNGFIAYSEFSSVRSTLLNNSIDGWNITTPLVLLHGESDEFVPPQVSENLYNDFRAKGVSTTKVKLVTFPGVDHPGGIVPCGIYAVKWFIDLKDAK